MVETVAVYIQENNAQCGFFAKNDNDGCAAPAAARFRRTNPLLPSLHTENLRRLCDPYLRRRRMTRPMEYRQAVAHILDEWSKISVQPIPLRQWQQRGGRVPLCERRCRLHRDLYAITERFAPGVMAPPVVTVGSGGTAKTLLSACTDREWRVPSTTTTIPGTNCGSDVPVVASGVCEICTTMLCESATATTPPRSENGNSLLTVCPPPALIRPHVPAAPVTSAALDAADRQPLSANGMEEREHCNLRTGVPAVANGSIYQRRVQFRLLLSGRSTPFLPSFLQGVDQKKKPGGVQKCHFGVHGAVHPSDPGCRHRRSPRTAGNVRSTFDQRGGHGTSRAIRQRNARSRAFPDARSRRRFAVRKMVPRRARHPHRSHRATAARHQRP